jgi:hypothetical protein
MVRPNLPTPSENLPRAIRTHFEMLIPPRFLLPEGHEGMCLCHDVGCHMTFHRQSVLSPVCLKEGYCTINDTEVPLPTGPLCFLENSSRFFFLDSESGRHAPALPQPFALLPDGPQEISSLFCLLQPIFYPQVLFHTLRLREVQTGGSFVAFSSQLDSLPASLFSGTK